MLNTKYLRNKRKQKLLDCNCTACQSMLEKEQDLTYNAVVIAACSVMGIALIIVCLMNGGRL